MMSMRERELAIAMAQELYPMDIQKRKSYVEMHVVRRGVN